MQATWVRLNFLGQSWVRLLHNTSIFTFKQPTDFLRTTGYIQCQKRALSLCLVLALPLKANKFNLITYPGVPVLWQLDNWLKVVELEAVIKTKNKLFTMRVSKKQNHDNSCSFYVQLLIKLRKVMSTNWCPWKLVPISSLRSRQL